MLFQTVQFDKVFCVNSLILQMLHFYKLCAHYAELLILIHYMSYSCLTPTPDNFASFSFFRLLSLSSKHKRINYFFKDVRFFPFQPSAIMHLTFSFSYSRSFLFHQYSFIRLFVLHLEYLFLFWFGVFPCVDRLPLQFLP